MIIHNQYNIRSERVGKIEFFDGVVGQIDCEGKKYYFSYENLECPINIGDYVRFNDLANEYNIVNNVKRYKELDEYLDDFNEGEMMR